MTSGGIIEVTVSLVSLEVWLVVWLVVRIESGRMGEITSTGVNTVVVEVALQFRPRQENPALVGLITIQTITENTAETRKSHLILVAYCLMQVFRVTF